MKPAGNAIVFSWVIPHLRNVARDHGYALGLHGSMGRDLDLIAAPWTEESAAAEVLVEAIRAAVDGRIDTLAHDPSAELDELRKNPAPKPHGRMAYSIYFCGRSFYIDLSVMPRKP